MTTGVRRAVATADLPPLSHGVMQVIADRAGVDLVHVKGPAVDPRLLASDSQGAVPRHSSDADLLVRPRHLLRFLSEARRHGWRMVTGFEDGSPFTHAASLWNDRLGYCDVHRTFPGLDADPETVFARLWADSTSVPIGHVDCRVPSLTGQRLLLLVHAARSHGSSHADVERSWEAATDAERNEVDALAADLGAEVALAAVTGRLDQYRDHPSHDLWAHFAGPDPGSRLLEWRVRLRAEPSRRRRVRAVVGALAVNRGHLEMDLGRPPGTRDIVVHQLTRLRLMVTELRRAHLARRSP